MIPLLLALLAIVRPVATHYLYYDLLMVPHESHPVHDMLSSAIDRGEELSKILQTGIDIYVDGYNEGIHLPPSALYVSDLVLHYYMRLTWDPTMPQHHAEGETR